MCVCMYIYIYIERERGRERERERDTQGRMTKGHGLFARISYVSTLCPNIICPYLCTSESPVWY